MILATWLSQAAVEEQTSVLLVILKVRAYFVLLINKYVFSLYTFLRISMVHVF